MTPPPSLRVDADSLVYAMALPFDPPASEMKEIETFPSLQTFLIGKAVARNQGLDPMPARIIRLWSEVAFFSFLFVVMIVVFQRFAALVGAVARGVNHTTK